MGEVKACYGPTLLCDSSGAAMTKTSDFDDGRAPPRRVIGKQEAIRHPLHSAVRGLAARGVRATGYTGDRVSWLDSGGGREPPARHFVRRERQLPTCTLLLHASCDATINCSPHAGGS
jgi:hypothetical protein